MQEPNPIKSLFVGMAVIAFICLFAWLWQTFPIVEKIVFCILLIIGFLSLSFVTGVFLLTDPSDYDDGPNYF